MSIQAQDIELAGVLQRKGTDSDSLLRQFCRYSLVGGLAFGFDFGSLWMLSQFLKVHYLISAMVAFLIGLAINYALSVTWVFNKRSVENRGVEFLVFGLIGIAGLALNELFIWFFTAIAGFHYLVSKIGSTAFVYSWNFFARRHSLFR
jgi:putative flippase GtrA